jgi:hypothetical protein
MELLLKLIEYSLIVRVPAWYRGKKILNLMKLKVVFRAREKSLPNAYHLIDLLL